MVVGVTQYYLARFMWSMLALLVMSWLSLMIAPPQYALAGLPEQVKLTSRGDINAHYAIDMIELALSKTGKGYRTDVSEGSLSTMRLREGLDNGEIDVIWTATSSEMESRYIPIRVPLYKGLLGYRILIIHQDNQDLFDNVHTMEEVLAHDYGQGLGWTDTDIMRASGLNVITTPKYHSLFHMADGQRFHGFPRGVHEPWSEVASRPELDLAIDQNLMLVYKMPYYLFVSNDRPELAEDLARGFEMAIMDGSFDQKFFQHPTVQMVMEKANMDKRRVFHLTNPDLPEKTPLNREELWFNPEEALMNWRNDNGERSALQASSTMSAKPL